MQLLRLRFIFFEIYLGPHIFFMKSQVINIDPVCSIFQRKRGFLTKAYYAYQTILSNLRGGLEEGNYRDYI